MRIDFEAAWLELAREVSSRQGIGRDGLLALMKRLEVEHSFDEEVVLRLMRRWGILFSEDLRAAARGDEFVNQSGVAPAGDGEAVPLVATDSDPGHQENREVHDGGSIEGRARSGQGSELRSVPA